MSPGCREEMDGGYQLECRTQCQLDSGYPVEHQTGQVQIIQYNIHQCSENHIFIMAYYDHICLSVCSCFWLVFPQAPLARENPESP